VLTLGCAREDTRVSIVDVVGTTTRPTASRAPLFRRSLLLLRARALLSLSTTPKPPQATTMPVNFDSQVNMPPDSVRDAEKDDGGDDSEFDGETMTNPSFGANTHLDLVRTMSMSTDKEVLRQLRDAMNPKQKQQTRVMLAQMTLGIIAVITLLVVVIIAYVMAIQIRNNVQAMAGQTAEMAQLTATMASQMEQLNANLAPVSVLPDFKNSLENMHAGVSELTEVMCSSPIFTCNEPSNAAPAAPATPGADTNVSFG